ncbi:S8 family serine peptidase [Cellulomonas fengjieae]|uniref:S8 family serine peptidase n=1 Tax=Cellulomonas fengjieae TaxID=2819978 RepID=UPI001AB00987|nr:S8 family serine peptidase [Cellulomonas fengjieae]MBO3102774.1 S8 family serine peptidase [Cellulomonas fengjieae]
MTDVLSAGSPPSRPRTFLVAQDTSINPASAGPLQFDWIVEQLSATPGVHVEKTLRPQNLRAMNLSSSVTDEVVVATMTEDVAADLGRHPQVLVEEDAPLLPQPAEVDAPTGTVDVNPGVLSPFGVSSSWTVQVTGTDGAPVAEATVYLYGSGVPVQGRTDGQGTVTLSLMNESDATLRALYVNPVRDYWSLWLARPPLTGGATTTITLQPLADTTTGFPGTEVLGWGQQAMRLDQVPADMSGRAIKVAVVDSGAAVTHPDLAAIGEGVDLTTTPTNDTQWRDDTIAHGSHCSGVIAGARNGSGVRGFAPDAELFEARIFPGGRISSLIDAVDYCIDHEIDVVNMSLGTGGTSQIMLQKLAQAKELGVACIVAAGNTGGEVQFPGTSPDVLTVSAIGRDGTFPETSYHAQQRWTGGSGDQGYFSAQFSCHGPEVDVAGPGVAVLSTVPATGYASWDGTSMATPHVAGLAALVLAHHPDFQTPELQLRGAARVDRLFAILKASATPLAFGDPHRVGHGLPDAPRALGLDAGAAPGGLQEAQATAVQVALAQLAQAMSRAGLLVDVASVQPLVSAHLAAVDSTGTSTQVRRGLADLLARIRGAGLWNKRPPEFSAGAGRTPF